MTEQEFEYERPWMYPKQLEGIFCDDRYVFVEGATKTGKTAAAMIWIWEGAILAAQAGHDGAQFWWVSSVYDTAAIAYRRLKQTIPKGLAKTNDSKLTITIPTQGKKEYKNREEPQQVGVVISFKSAQKPDNLYGDDVQRVVADEATRWAEEAWIAIRTVITNSGGLVRVLMNVKGRQNWAYRLCRIAQSGQSPNMKYVLLTAWDAVEAGLLPKEEIEDAKKLLPEQIFNELYLCIPSDDGGNPFGLKAIEACVFGQSEAEPVVWGIDLAKSMDWTVCIGLDRFGVVCRFERWQGHWNSTKRKIKELVGMVPALVDSTGVGDPVLEDLQAENTYTYEGYVFSQRSKQQLMEGLAIAIQQGKVRYPAGTIKDELSSFEYEYSRTGVKYTAPRGLHDDCVMALALAVHKASNRQIFRDEDLAKAFQDAIETQKWLFN